MDHSSIENFVLSCQNEDGGFGGNTGHDSHLLYTLSAIQILLLINRLDVLDIDMTVKCCLH